MSNNKKEQKDNIIDTGNVVNLEQIRQRVGESRIAEVCPYCQSKNFVKRGFRQNQYQNVQLYLCKNTECNRTFTAQDVKGKHFPLNVVIEAMSYYNLGFSLEETCKIIMKKFNTTLPNVPVPKFSGVEPEGIALGSSTSATGSFIAPTPETLSSWIQEYAGLCRYERLRPYAIKMCKPKDTIEVVSMAHRQLYRFRYHRPKTALMLTEFKNRNLRRLQEYLNAVSSETPHQYFADGERMSEVRSKFSTADMIVKSKSNYANRLATFVLQTVSENKARHEALQRFFIANDSCTVATEVPVYIRREDVEYMENVLKFKVLNDPILLLRSTPTLGRREVDKMHPPRLASEPPLKEGNKKFPRLLTGHIDLVQIRNGQIHIMDYKPNASKERPIEQLTWYALALSRLTGLRLFEFTCAWFDEKDYYQFFPLHVVKKLQTKAIKPRKRFVNFKDGTKVEVPRENLGKVVIV
ncbi:MAG: PD-(D/E)XK nuclease family protein [Candidatus Parcubacteria bacterium]|nr:PD-(D/E)XK nuclease family protein [Candidatus Parcubacteria bacterium]